jgi:selenium metabolism protein YedF
MKTVVVNAVGDQCPIPVVKTLKAMSALTEPSVIEVLVDAEVPVQNLTRLAAGKGLPCTAEKLEEGRFAVRMEVADPVALQTGGEEAVCYPDQRENIVVAIASECMGHGDKELGATLMKGFVYALSQQEVLPRTVLLYNGGAKLSVEGAVTVEDLKSMEAQGVEILTCGTCLNFYGLQDRLAVGSVTNMYTIVERLMQADKVIKQ